MRRSSRSGLDDRITSISARLARPDPPRRAAPESARPAAVSAEPDAPLAERIDLARKVVAARLSREIRRERWQSVSRSDLARMATAATHAYCVRQHLRLTPPQARELVTDIIQTLIIPGGPAPRPRGPAADPPIALGSPLEMLAAAGTMSPEMAAVLQSAVRHRLNIVVSGLPGSGCTTLLNALCRAIDDPERTVVMEELHELLLDDPRIVRLDVAGSRLDGSGAATMQDLLKSALVMRPGRLIVGECRDAAALHLVQAMSGGQDGSMTVVAAGSPAEALSRLEEMVGLNLEPDARRGLIASAIHLVCHMELLPDGKRRLTRFAEIAGTGDSGISTRDLFAYRAAEDSAELAAGAFLPTDAAIGFLARMARQQPHPEPAAH